MPKEICDSQGACDAQGQVNPKAGLRFHYDRVDLPIQRTKRNNSGGIASMETTRQLRIFAFSFA
jgi:hypothetical protein